MERSAALKKNRIREIFVLQQPYLIENSVSWQKEKQSILRRLIEEVSRSIRKDALRRDVERLVFGADHFGRFDLVVGDETLASEAGWRNRAVSGARLRAPSFFGRQGAARSRHPDASIAIPKSRLNHFHSTNTMFRIGLEASPQALSLRRGDADLVP